MLADKYCQTGLREVTGVLQSQCLVGVNSAVEGQRVKLRFAGASCQSEQPWSSGYQRGGGKACENAAGESSNRRKTKTKKNPSQCIS